MLGHSYKITHLGLRMFNWDVSDTKSYLMISTRDNQFDFTKCAANVIRNADNDYLKRTSFLFTRSSDNGKLGLSGQKKMLIGGPNKWTITPAKGEISNNYPQISYG